MEILKNKIKELSSNQKSLKNQRKTVNLVGERTMSSFKAATEHADNRVVLRHLYVVYAILRNKPVESTGMTLDSPKIYSSWIKGFLAQYGEEAVRVDV